MRLEQLVRSRFTTLYCRRISDGCQRCRGQKGQGVGRIDVTLANGNPMTPPHKEPESRLPEHDEGCNT